MRPEDLDRAGFDIAVRVYRNLFHHRREEKVTVPSLRTRLIR